VSAYDVPGLVGGLAGTWLFMIGAAIAAGAGLRMALVLRQPEKGRLAKGVGAAGGLIGVAGLALFWGAQGTRFQREFDRATPVVVVAAVVLGAIVAWRIGRRRPAAPQDAGGGPAA
jgi:hypothetical protein